VSLSPTLLGLLEAEPTHGYELKRQYDSLFGPERLLAIGQIYASLARLLRDGLVSEAGTTAGAGPDRKRYAITDDGIRAFERWLAEPEPPEPQLQTALFAKIVLALLSGRPAGPLLDTQREAHLQRMRQLTALRKRGPLSITMLADYGLFHLDADLKWMEKTAARLDDLAQEIAR
jgi:DNA-binding PadR family transcriptional regulator